VKTRTFGTLKTYPNFIKQGDLEKPLHNLYVRSFPTLVSIINYILMGKLIKYYSMQNFFKV